MPRTITSFTLAAARTASRADPAERAGLVGNRWIDLFLSAGLSPHRVHHVLPYQGSGFANLATEATVREVATAAGIVWERPKSLLFDRFPAVIKHYLFCPVKAPAPMPPPPPPSSAPPPPRNPFPVRPGRPTVKSQVGDLVRYTFDGWRGVGV